MSEATEVAAVVPQQPLSIEQAAERFAAKRAPAQPNNEISAHASAMGKRAAEVRQARKTEAPAQPETGENALNDPTKVKTEDETQSEIVTENDAPPDDQTPEDQDEPQEGTIDLGDGVKVTLDEVRDGFMLKADHTRKTQALAEERREVETIRTQKLAQLDQLIARLEPATGENQPKSRRDFIAEYGVEDGLDKWEAHQRQVEAVKEIARRTRAEADTKAKAKALAERDQDLSENYNKEWAVQEKRNAAYTKITGYALKEGVPAEVLQDLTEPWAIRVLDKARQFDAIQAGKGQIQKVLTAAPPVIRPGAKMGTQALAQSGVQAARKQLETSGTWQDAVSVLRAQRKARGA